MMNDGLWHGIIGSVVLVGAIMCTAERLVRGFQPPANKLAGATQFADKPPPSLLTLTPPWRNARARASSNWVLELGARICVAAGCWRAQRALLCCETASALSSCCAAAALHRLSHHPLLRLCQPSLQPAGPVPSVRG